MQKLLLRTLYTVTILVGIMYFDTTSALAAPQDLPPGFTATVLIDYNMTAPTGVKVAPDGRIFVFDLFGTIKIFTEGSGFNSQNFGSIPVNATGDRGLLGAVFDTDFANNPYVYIHYVGTDSKVHIGRFNASGNIGSDFTDLYVAPAASGYQHAGGGITMDQNGYIYFGIGDSGTPTNSQDVTVSHGKIHRISRDGTVPVNPFYGQAGVASTTYAHGVRNPFRMTFDRTTGLLYVGDVGFNNWEEVNEIKPGKNYGWALQEGPCAAACPYEDPIYWYSHQFGTNNSNDASIVMGPVYRGSYYPASYYGKVFITDYVQGFLRTIDPAVTSSSSATVSTGNGALIDMDFAPNGKMYFVTISSPKLYRLDYSSSSVNLPPIAVASTTSTTTGAAPLSISFSSNGSTDPEGLPLSYLWNFGDGATSSAANPTKVYAQNGQYSARVTVSDGTNTVQSNPITIVAGSAPTLTIGSSLGATQYVAGAIVPYTVTATDSDGQTLASTSITTMVRLQHSDHSHPFAGPFVGNTGQVITPLDGELSPNVWLRFTFDAVGASGIHTTRDVDVYPRLAQITVTTNPAGLNVILDGSNHIIPPTVQGVVGMNRQIAAPTPQVSGGVQYVFDYWSDGGAQDHTFAFPATTTTYTAFYRATSSTAPASLVNNGSFENSGSLPSNWFFSRWGDNTIAASLVPDARTGSWSVKMDATQITTGDERIYHTPIAISSGKIYSVQYFYKTNVAFKSVADVTLNDNTHRYIWLGISQPYATWKEQNWSFTTPANSKNVTVNIYHVNVGTMQIDDFTLFDPQATVPTDITFTAAPTSITTGASTTLAWSVLGTTPICTASGAWTGAQATNGSLVQSPTSTQTYTLTCSNAAGTTTKSVTVTVTAPVITSLITNQSVENASPTDTPLGWSSSRWGTNDGVFEYTHGDAYDGDHSLKATITTITNGEASWVTDPIAVAPSTNYTFNEYTKSTGSSKVLVEMTLVGGGKSYYWLGQLPNASTWTLFSKTFPTPAVVVTIRIGTYITGVGSFTIDQINLTTAAPVAAPTLVFSADNTTITPGANATLRWTTTGSNVTCTSSNGWTGTQAANGTTVMSPLATTTYTLACSNGSGTDTKSVTINVSSTPPPVTGTNLITPNSSFDGNTWVKGSWGANTADFSVATTGRTDSSSLRVIMSNYTYGDAKWIFTPVSVATNTSYSYSHWYKSDTPSELVAEYTLADNSKTHTWLGTAALSADWTQKSLTLTTPANAVKVTIHHVLKAAGTLDTDDYSLVQN